MRAKNDTTDKQGRQYDVRGNVRYRISNTHRGSAALGPCEVCGKHADEVFLQTQQRRYEHGGETGWTQYECPQVFGHETCLFGARA